MATKTASKKIKEASPRYIGRYIVTDPEICHGKPCVRGVRYPVETILEYLAGGDSVEDLLMEFPDLQHEDILACLEFSRRMLAAKTVHLVLA